MHPQPAALLTVTRCHWVTCCVTIAHCRTPRLIVSVNGVFVISCEHVSPALIVGPLSPVRLPAAERAPSAENAIPNGRAHSLVYMPGGVAPIEFSKSRRLANPAAAPEASGITGTMRL